jgi:hypothetical protein
VDDLESTVAELRAAVAQRKALQQQVAALQPQAETVDGLRRTLDALQRRVAEAQALREQLALAEAAAATQPAPQALAAALGASSLAGPGGGAGGVAVHVLTQRQHAVMALSRSLNTEMAALMAAGASSSELAVPGSVSARARSSALGAASLAAGPAGSGGPRASQDGLGGAGGVHAIPEAGEEGEMEGEGGDCGEVRLSVAVRIVSASGRVLGVAGGPGAVLPDVVGEQLALGRRQIAALEEALEELSNADERKEVLQVRGRACACVRVCVCVCACVCACVPVVEGGGDVAAGAPRSCHAVGENWATPPPRATPRRAPHQPRHNTPCTTHRMSLACVRPPTHSPATQARVERLSKSPAAHELMALHERLMGLQLSEASKLKEQVGRAGDH